MEESKIRNGRNLTNIEYINVYGLFDRYDVNIPFDKIANIYIGENGMGKTTILNCIYFLLDKKFTRLSEMNFDSIEIKFKTESQPHRISIYDINKYNQRGIPRGRRYVDDDLIEHMLEEMLNEYDENMLYNHKLYIEDTADMVARRISRMFDIPFSVARRSVYEYMDTKRFSLDKNKKGEIEKVKRLISSINKNIDQKILYLPTYRRIEDDFSKLNISAEKVRESDLLIRFGMSDVLILKNKILENIRQEAIDGFNKMAGVLLKQYANSTDKTDIFEVPTEVDIRTVKLILDRIGDEIDDESKAEIIELISTRKIYSGKYKLLKDLIDKLIISYESQREYDDRIKLFADTCNKYMNGKKFYYNPSELTLDIYIESKGEITTEIVELPQLSSGEKQIVSLFSKLYLENEKETIVIIDEPELSLSIKWQSMLLPDIIRSGNCKMLLTVTHSPFIFDNEFDLDAREMRKYIKYTDGE